MSSQIQVPNTPKVISPSPTLSEQTGKDGYFAPVTRSRGSRPVQSTVEHASSADKEEHPDLRRARTRNRTDKMHMNGSITAEPGDSLPSAPVQRSSKKVEPKENGQANGLLSPTTAYKQSGKGSSYWRNLSRSPSPLGLIPIHEDFRAFIHKHEIPRKALHVSIGFVTLYLYWTGVQTSSIHPYLLSALIPITIVDLIRFQWPAFNDLYIKVMGAFMRESEAHDRFNGVISYLAGLWATMYFCRKDVAVMSVLLLSWCDTAASTFGRAYGKYTPKIRKGKSLAGSIACFVFGVASAWLFWGVIASRTDSSMNQGVNSFAFQGTLQLPARLRGQLRLNADQGVLSGNAALITLSLVSGLIASVSEALDLWELDDNLTIPILCGLGIGVFLHLFGSV